MENAVRELIGALTNRVKSHYLGNVAVFVVLLNWSEFATLFFADWSLRSRLVFFEMKTDICTLLFYPLGLGLIISLAVPYVNFFLSFVASKPVHWERVRDMQNATKVASERQRLELEAEIERAKLRIELSDTLSDEVLKQADAQSQIEQKNLSSESLARYSNELRNVREKVEGLAANDSSNSQWMSHSKAPSDWESTLRNIGLTNLDYWILEFLHSGEALKASLKTDPFKALTANEKAVLNSYIEKAGHSNLNEEKCRILFNETIQKLEQKGLVSIEFVEGGGSSNSKLFHFNLTLQGYEGLEAFHNRD